MNMSGIPCAGKTWVSYCLKKYAPRLLLPENAAPYYSDDAATLRARDDVATSGDDQDVLAKVADLLPSRDTESRNSLSGNGVFGRAVSLAYTGAAAGVASGYTCHKALGLDIHLHKDVTEGSHELPQPSGPQLQNLRDLWRGTKLLIFDEVYCNDAAFMYLFHQRLCHIFQTPLTTAFGGLAVIFSGDPRQIQYYKGFPLMTSSSSSLANATPCQSASARGDFTSRSSLPIVQLLQSLTCTGGANCTSHSTSPLVWLTTNTRLLQQRRPCTITRYRRCTTQLLLQRNFRPVHRRLTQRGLDFCNMEGNKYAPTRPHKVQGTCFRHIPRVEPCRN